MKILAKFRKDFEEILEDPNTNRRDFRLTNLMSEMDGTIQISLLQNLEWEARHPEKLNYIAKSHRHEYYEILKDITPLHKLLKSYICSMLITFFKFKMVYLW